MGDSYSIDSLVALSGALFIFNRARHMVMQKDKNLAAIESRFGKGSNIIFGIAMVGIIYFDHRNYTIVHYIFAGIFLIGCALAIILIKETSLRRQDDILGWLTLVIGSTLYFKLDLRQRRALLHLIFAKWIGLIFNVAYFILALINRRKKKKLADLTPK